MKVVIASNKELLLGLSFAALLIIGAQFFRAIETLDYCPNKIQTEALFKKNRLAEGTYIINSVEQDSLKQWEIGSYIQFEGSNSYSKVPQIKKVDLYDPKYKNLPFVYTTYYIILGLLWTAVFYHLYQYLKSIKKSQTFEKANLKHLYLSGRFISIIYFIYFFCLTSFSIVHNYLFQLRIPYISTYQYEQMMMFFMLILLHLILRLYAKSTLSGMEMKTEQDLTV
jgi:hypothetical protein